MPDKTISAKEELPPLLFVTNSAVPQGAGISASLVTWYVPLTNEAQTGDSAAPFTVDDAVAAALIALDATPGDAQTRDTAPADRKRLYSDTIRLDRAKERRAYADAVMQACRDQKIELPKEVTPTAISE